MFHSRDRMLGRDWELLFLDSCTLFVQYGKSSSLWDIPYGTLPESENRELMSFGDSNLEAQTSPAQNLASVLVCALKCFSEHSPPSPSYEAGGDEGRTDWQNFKMF